MKDLDSKKVRAFYTALPKRCRKKVRIWRQQFVNRSLDEKIIEGFKVLGLLSLLQPANYHTKIKKDKLLQMAKDGVERPKQKRHELGKVLGQYTDPKTTSYDEEFSKEIRRLRPDWFVQLKMSKSKKQQLLDLAFNKSPKPYFKSELGRALQSYCSPSSNCYDEEFKNKIYSLASEWFIKLNPIDFREEILKLAMSGSPKPNWKTQIGTAVIRYTNPSQNGYDPEFDKKIKQLRPDWFKNKK